MAMAASNLSSRSKTLDRDMEVENLDNHKKRKKIKLDERDSEKKSHTSSEKRKKKIKLADRGLESFVEVKSCLRETCIDKDKKEEKKKKRSNETAGNGSMEDGGCTKDYNVHHGKRKSWKNVTEEDASEKENNVDGGPHSLKEEERKKNTKITNADKSGSEEKEKVKTVDIKEHVLKEGNGCEGGEICDSNDVIMKKKKKKSKSKEHGTLEESIGTEESHFSKDEKGKDRARKKTTSVKPNLEEKLARKKGRMKKNVQDGDHSEIPTSVGTSKRVSFSDDVEVFPLPDDRSNDKRSEEDGEVEGSDIVRGKRFSKKEDEMVKKAVLEYIETHDLGDKGLYMVIHCKSFPEIKHCWKEISAALPWRPPSSIYHRAHILFERDETRKWTREELEIVRRYHQEHGSDWRKLADQIGRLRFHVKDAWRRIKLPDKKKGRWSQEEYQSLYDLVNADLRMRAFEEKKSKHGMLRDNISWASISDRLATRTNASCCMKWYRQLISPMVAEGVWADVDDYHLVDALCTLDACSMEDVDWDNLLNHRAGYICRKRWNQMVKHIGENRNKSFSEQVDILSDRYCSNVIEAKEAYDAKPFVS